MDFGDESLGLDSRKMARTGYCGIRKIMTSGSESLCVQDFDILRLLIRGDGNVYNLNVSGRTKANSEKAARRDEKVGS